VVSTRSGEQQREIPRAATVPHLLWFLVRTSARADQTRPVGSLLFEVARELGSVLSRSRGASKRARPADAGEFSQLCPIIPQLIRAVRGGPDFIDGNSIEGMEAEIVDYPAGETPSHRIPSPTAKACSLMLPPTYSVLPERASFPTETMKDEVGLGVHDMALPVGILIAAIALRGCPPMLEKLPPT
jgi:hypothetical protein